MQPHPPASSTAPPPEDPYRYGWREVKQSGGDGKEEWLQVPLTLEDVLHPQEGDVILQSKVHAEQCRYLADVFNTLELSPPLILITEDQGIDWGLLGLRHHSPDAAILVGLLRYPNRERAILNLQETGGRPLLVAEVVSPSTRINDVQTKVLHYHQVRVPFYLLIDQQEEDGPRSLVGYRWAPAGFELMPLDEQGRLWMEVLGLFFVLRDNRVFCQDRNGQEIGDYGHVRLQLEEADRRIREQEEALEEAVEQRQLAQRERKNAEKKAQDETNARLEAEQQRNEEQEKRQKAEREQKAAQDARAEAQKKASDEAEARALAEKKASDEAAARARLEREAGVALREVRALVLALGEATLGQPGQPQRERLEALTDPTVLTALCRRVRSVSSWDELLAPGNQHP